jgi:A/G-specific adenine glycosylase
MKDKDNTYPGMRERLLRWFDENQRDLPWRKEHKPYEIWVSEIMLQQTQVKTMLPFYFRWMARFPDLESLAGAPEEELLKCWEGMGYYSRVRSIHRTARMVMNDFGGEIPRDHRTLLSFPGIGPYTAGAIMSFAFNEDYPVVDGNIERIFARVFNIDRPIKENGTQNLLWKLAKELLPTGEARRFNQALMDLGALVCLPRKTYCEQCPIEKYCESAKLGVVHLRPVPTKRKAATPIEVAAGVLLKEGKIFIQKRPPTGLMPNLWEFPGGKVKDGETPEEALVREFREELGLEVRSSGKIALIRHSYTSFRVSLHAFWCRQEGQGEPVLRAASESLWVSPSDLDRYAFPAANRKLVHLIRNALVPVVTGG